MGAKGFVFKLLCKEITSRLLPTAKDVATALVLSIAFGLVCGFQPVGYIIFFMISLAIVYVISRITCVIHACMTLNRARKKVGCIVDSVGDLSGLLKK